MEQMEILRHWFSVVPSSSEGVGSKQLSLLAEGLACYSLQTDFIISMSASSFPQINNFFVVIFPPSTQVFLLEN